MMVRSLVDEVVRRRLWPVVLVALLVIVAAPVLFMKSAPADAPAATEAPPAAAPGDLPARAAHLLATSDATVTAKRRSQRAGQDPFAPPVSQSTEPAKKAAGTAKSAPAQSTGSARQTKPVEVVIKNPDGSTPSTQSKQTAPPVNNSGPGRTYPASAGEPSFPTVDVRFAERQNGKLLRRVDRLQMFRVGEKPVAVFVKWSPKRKKAVFAIAPTTIVGGDVECRRKAGVCRFVDIAVGKYARLTVVAEDGSLVTRRLDVVRAHRAG